MGGGFFRPEVTKHIYPGFCCRDSAGSADGLDLWADRGLSRQLLYHMANMGMELFEPNWINAIVLFFSCLGCAPIPLDFLLKMRYPKTKKQRNMYICAVRGIEWEG